MKGREMIEELHEINCGILTFGSGSKHSLKLEDKIEEILGGNDNISANHRNALEHKSLVLLKRQSMLLPTAAVKHDLRAREFCAKIVAIMEANGTNPKLIAGGDFQYIPGFKLTALDAHASTLLRRFHDTDRNELIPSMLVEWARKFGEGDLWDRVVANGTTLPPYVLQRCFEDDLDSSLIIRGPWLRSRFGVDPDTRE